MSLYLGNVVIPNVGVTKTVIGLPSLSNPATADDIASGKQVIDGDGNLLTGTGSVGGSAENLDAEISAQNTLISEQDAKIGQLAEILEGKAGGGGEGSGGNVEITINSSSARLVGYIDADTRQSINNTSQNGNTIKPLYGAIIVYGGAVASTTCEYFSCTCRNGYYMHIFLSSGEVTLS